MRREAFEVQVYEDRNGEMRASFALASGGRTIGVALGQSEVAALDRLVAYARNVTYEARKRGLATMPPGQYELAIARLARELGI